VNEALASELSAELLAKDKPMAKPEGSSKKTGKQKGSAIRQ
tara:strand:+ start:408 stop:530 length:123 start_codon:yes stop_codon:yes gene_type:complete